MWCRMVVGSPEGTLQRSHLTFGGDPSATQQIPTQLVGICFNSRSMSWSLFLIPLSCAFCGWLVATLMLAIIFHPFRPRSIFGLRIQGILPAKQSAIAIETGKYAAEHFFSMKMVEEKVADPANLQKIMPAIEAHIDDFLRNKLKKQMPFIGMFVGEKTINSLKKVFIAELESLFPKIMSSYASSLANDLNIEQLVAGKLNEVSMKEIESAFRRKFSKELRLARVMSALIGAFVGLVVMFTIFFLK